MSFCRRRWGCLCYTWLDCKTQTVSQQGNEGKELLIRAQSESEGAIRRNRQPRFTSKYFVRSRPDERMKTLPSRRTLTNPTRESEMVRNGTGRLEAESHGPMSATSLLLRLPKVPTPFSGFKQHETRLYPGHTHPKTLMCCRQICPRLFRRTNEQPSVARGLVNRSSAKQARVPPKMLGNVEIAASRHCISTTWDHWKK